MAFMTKGPLKLVCFLFLFLVGQVLAAPVGLNTRDQNPMFQAYYLPSIDLNSHQGWQVSHSVYLTSAFQSTQQGNETLILDVENYRYDFSIAYQQNKWRLSAVVPFIFNEGGSFDGAIEDWHDFFGLPQGGRKSRPHDQIDVIYTRNGQTFFSQTETTNAIGDIAVSLSYSLADSNKNLSAISFAIDLPTGSENNISGNEAVDVALWLSQAYRPSKLTSLYGIFGVSLLGQGGQLERLQESIVWVGQIGLEHQLYPDWNAILQFDAHTAFIEGSELKTLGNSLQVQIGLRVKKITQDHDIDLFFSEDILAGSAPDITIGARLYQSY
ncbi:MAG: hypothetical protein ACI9JR_001232 [Gammaproteobacteria bacterium]|jgi:hypothetical protein